MAVHVLGPSGASATYKPDTNSYAFIDSGGAYGFGWRKMFIALLGNQSIAGLSGRGPRHLGGALSENVLRRTGSCAISSPTRSRTNAASADTTLRRGTRVERSRNSDAWPENFRRWTVTTSRSATSHQSRPCPTQNMAGYRHARSSQRRRQMGELIASPGKRLGRRRLPLSPPAAGRPALFALTAAERRLSTGDGRTHLRARECIERGRMAIGQHKAESQAGLPKAAADLRWDSQRRAFLRR